MTEGIVGRKVGRRSWRGSGLFVLSMPSCIFDSMDRKEDFERRVPEVENSRRIWKIIVALRKTASVKLIRGDFTKTIDRIHEPRSRKKKLSKKRILVEPASTFSLFPPPSHHGVHAFSGEFALADSVAGASGSTGAHVTVDTLGTPWTFFPYQIQTRSHQQIFLLCDATTSKGKHRVKNRHL